MLQRSILIILINTLFCIPDFDNIAQISIIITNQILRLTFVALNDWSNE